MGEVPLHTKYPWSEVEGYFTHQKTAFPRTLQSACARGPMVVQGARGKVAPHVQGYLAHRKMPPPRTTIGPWVQPYCRVLGAGGFFSERYPCIP
jgi:hypothetical protein